MPGISFSDAYHVASGLAWARGIEDFETRMPKDRARGLFRAHLCTSGYRWAGLHFSMWLVKAARFESREGRE